MRQLLFDPAFGLTEIQIGQGCGSLTMPMTDMRLSAMTAALTEEFVGMPRTVVDDGWIIIGSKAENLRHTWSGGRLSFRGRPDRRTKRLDSSISQRVLTKPCGNRSLPDS